MKKVAVIFAAAVALSACSQTVGGIDTAIRENLPQTCDLAATAHAAFVTVAATGDLKQSTVVKEQAAWDALQVICRDPSSVTTATILVRAAEAYAAITRALREAKQVEA